MSFSSKFLVTFTLKNPLDTSFIMPSPPIGIMFLNPCSKYLAARLVPSPDFSVNTTS